MSPRGEFLLTVTAPVVRKLFIEATEVLTGYGRGRVLVETMTDRRPKEGAPYCTLWFKSLEPLPVNVGDFYYEGAEDADATQVIDNESLCTVQFSFWGEGAFAEAAQYMQTLHSQRRFHDLWRIVGFAGIDSVQDVSTAFGSRIQQRAYFNLDYYVCLGREFPADWFDTSQWRIALPKQHREEWPYSKEDRDGNACNLP